MIRVVYLAQGFSTLVGLPIDKSLIVYIKLFPLAESSLRSDLKLRRRNREMSERKD
jgi:hypothetical protein